jgi:hypothetical protein
MPTIKDDPPPLRPLEIDDSTCDEQTQEISFSLMIELVTAEALDRRSASQDGEGPKIPTRRDPSSQ